MAKYIFILFAAVSFAACKPSRGPGPGSNSNRLGFYSMDSSSIPQSVRDAAGSVFLIVTPAGQITTAEAIFGDHTVQEIINHIQAMPLSEKVLQADKDVYLYQLRLCGRDSRASKCQLREGNKQSSGYLMGKGNQIRTAFHALRDLVKSSSQRPTSGKYVSAKVAVFVYNAQGKMIWSPSSGSAIAHFPKTNLYIEQNNSGTITPPNDDLAEIELARPIGRPLIPNSVAPKTGDKIYLIGYPQKSSDRAQFGMPDAPGGQLRVSIGNVLPPNLVAKKLGIAPGSLSELSKSILQGLIATDADGTPGLSGGATVNSDGQVVGTYTSGFPADGSASLNHVSYSSDDSQLHNPFGR